jgi:hypothetical protein
MLLALFRPQDDWPQAHKTGIFNAGVLCLDFQEASITTASHQFLSNASDGVIIRSVRYRPIGLVTLKLCDSTTGYTLVGIERIAQMTKALPGLEGCSSRRELAWGSEMTDETT